MDELQKQVSLLHQSRASLSCPRQHADVEDVWSNEVAIVPVTQENPGGEPHVTQENPGGEPHVTQENPGGEPHVTQENPGGEPHVTRSRSSSSRVKAPTGTNRPSVYRPEV
ncbi:unnamed protein product [Pleuronectes platessa]|uniref:Uncharacterized protein n=1 Tax=Pleuronectes platessa TaxID=8262 RepID=A0A9N7TTJ1_PLEPL|nr:unnamed protein product [Pleuronectes platessa]